MTNAAHENGDGTMFDDVQVWVEWFIDKKGNNII